MRTILFVNTVIFLLSLGCVHEKEAISEESQTMIEILFDREYIRQEEEGMIKELVREMREWMGKEKVCFAQIIHTHPIIVGEEIVEEKAAEESLPHWWRQLSKWIEGLPIMIGRSYRIEEKTDLMEKTQESESTKSQKEDSLLLSKDSGFEQHFLGIMVDEETLEKMVKVHGEELEKWFEEFRSISKDRGHTPYNR